MKYKLLALDIDGTIVKEETNIISKPVINAIKKAAKKINIALVSARAWNNQQMIIDFLGLENRYHVVENGTKVINPTGELEYCKLLNAQESKKIIGETSDFYDNLGLCIGGKWKPKHELAASDMVSTISFISKSRKQAKKIPRALKKFTKKYHITIGRHWSELKWSVTLVSHRDASKGAGLKYIQNKLGVVPAQTIAVGDGASDISMMDYAAKKVAMGNAEDGLLQIANYIAPSVLEDGLVNVINKFVL
jgi:hypothetical protein